MQTKSSKMILYNVRDTSLDGKQMELFQGWLYRSASGLVSSFRTNTTPLSPTLTTPLERRQYLQIVLMLRHHWLPAFHGQAILVWILRSHRISKPTPPSRITTRAHQGKNAIKTRIKSHSLNARPSHSHGFNRNVPISFCSCHIWHPPAPIKWTKNTGMRSSYQHQFALALPPNPFET